LITAIYASLSIAFLLYPFFLLFDLTLDADKLGAGFAFVFLLGMWLLLGVALMLSKIRGEIPLWSALIALPLMLLSLILVAMSAYGLPDLSAAGNSVRWMVGVHALVPLILFLYVGWASIPRAHGLLSANRAFGHRLECGVRANHADHHYIAESKDPCGPAAKENRAGSPHQIRSHSVRCAGGAVDAVSGNQHFRTAQ
jgi:hypothetical protein